MKKHGFTLVELLVVIAVIALLAGLLFSAAQSAKESAQTVECASNLRQLVLANLAYSSDHDGSFVQAQERTNTIRWHGVRSSTSAAFDPAKGPLAPYLGFSGKIKLCPSFQDALADKNSFENSSGGYGYNYTYIGGNPQTTFDPMTVSSVLDPANTVMFTDTAFARANGVQEYPFTEPYEWVDSNNHLAGALAASTHFRHRGKANVAWSDGHVTQEKPARLDSVNYYGGDGGKQKIGWFGPSEDNGFWNPKYRELHH